MDFLYYAIPLSLVVFVIVTFIFSVINTKIDLWQLTRAGAPTVPGVYPVLFNDDGEYTTMAEWDGSRWMDHCTGEPYSVAPVAFYVLPARNWHD